MKKKRKIICIGALSWDYIAITNLQLKFGDDLPGQITKKPGGVASNIARAISELSHIENRFEIFLISALGNDSSGEELKKTLIQYGINCDYLITNNGNSDQYVAIESGGKLVCAVSDNSQLLRAESKMITTLLREDVFRAKTKGKDILILDTNLTTKAFEKLSDENSFNNYDFVVVAASPKKVEDLTKFFKKRSVILYSNLDEAKMISNQNFNGTEEAAKYLVEMGASSAIITDSGNKVSSFCAHGLASINPEKSKNVNATGAGDFFLAAHLLSKILNPSYSPKKHLNTAEVTTREKIKATKTII